jgi:hypothetical protein
MYLPFITKSLKGGRGFEIGRLKYTFEPGYTNDGGFSIKNTLEYRFSTAASLKGFFDYLGKRGNGYGGEFDYFTPTIKGAVYVYKIDDLSAGMERWTVRPYYWQRINKEWTIQFMLFKKEKTYIPIHPVSTSINFTSNRFYKQNAFEGNDFFYQSAHLILLTKYELEKKVQSLTEDDTQKIILEKELKEQPKISEKREDTKELLEIDLHIHELIDDLRGLSNAEMLKIQLDKFNSVMKANMLNKGKKIVFIHGVGNGTLKTELRKQLEQNYKGLYYLDASFKEYGFGATMVIM